MAQGMSRVIWVRSLVAVFNTTRHALSLELSRLATALEEAANR